MEDFLTGEDSRPARRHSRSIVKCVKNKVGPPMRTAECPVPVRHGLRQRLVGGTGTHRQRGKIVQGTSGYFYFDTQEGPGRWFTPT
jgi:hypothetical protein